MKTTESVLWLFDKVNDIRVAASRDAEKLDALSKDPALEREALEKFPDEPMLYQQLQALLETDRILARQGVFLTPRSFWEEI
ncbi:hypothetical protein [Cystobacter fuscus]|uniref:hypothetical protein n=1 Tax=Cystobacter fuscus TaxID=43 RepID=UPI0012DE725A|nr:hypothetical protein [Cystobacter fuscus]